MEDCSSSFEWDNDPLVPSLLPLQLDNYTQIERKRVNASCSVFKLSLKRKWAKMSIKKCAGESCTLLQKKNLGAKRF